MFYDMRYKGGYTKHVSIDSENKKLNWDVML